MSNTKRKTKTRLDQRDDVFLEIISLLNEYGSTGKEVIAENAGVHWTTLYNWCAGKTMTPRIDTLVKVAKELGYEVVLRKSHKATPILRRVK